MRTLTESEKTEVRKMLDTRGFQIMEGLVEDYRNDLLAKFTTLSLGDKNVIEELTQSQNHLKGINDFIKTIKGSKAGIGKKKD